MPFLRFLSYSLDHNRPVRILLDDRPLRYVNLTVIGMDQEGFLALKHGRKSPLVIRYDQVLAVSYARGDDGNSIKDSYQSPTIIQGE